MHALNVIIAHSLVHMHQKKKIALGIATKIAGVNGPLAVVKESPYIQF